MSILRLPHELLGKILELCRPYTFEAFALSCKHIYSVAEVSLVAHNRLRRRFRHFSFADSLEDAESPQTHGEHIFFVLQLLLEIAAEPIIPAYIVHADLGKRIYFPDYIAGRYNLPFSIPPKLRGDDIKRKLRGLLEGSTHLKTIGASIEEWTAAIYDDKNEFDEPCDYATAFLLSLLTNVESLTLHGEWNMENVRLERQSDDQMETSRNEVAKLVHLLVTQANGEDTDEPLHRLAHLRPTPDVDSQSGVETLTIFPFLGLKSMETVGHQYGKYEIWNNTTSLPGYPMIGSGLKTLELSDYVVDKESADVLFRDMKNLRAFKLKYVMLDEIGGNWSAGTFIQGLIDAVGSQLEVLSINIGMLWTNEDPVVSLQGLTALRELDLDVQLFYRWQSNDVQALEAEDEDQEDDDEDKEQNDDEGDEEEDGDDSDDNDDDDQSEDDDEYRDDEETMSLLYMLPETLPSLEMLTLRCLPIVADLKRLQNLLEGYAEGRNQQLPALESAKVIFDDSTSTLRNVAEDKEIVKKGIFSFRDTDGVEVEEASWSDS